MKIAIVGVGGVGGVVGGLLTKQNKHKITFICRGERKTAIAKEGLKVKTPLCEEFTAHPYLVTDKCDEKMDIIIVATKAYALANVCEIIKPMIVDNTIVIPLLNGVGIGKKIAQIVGKGIILEGCVYISAFISGINEVTHANNILRVIFGVPTGMEIDETPLKELQETFKEVGINGIFSDNIEVEVWKKFVFLCAYASVSSYYGITVGEFKKQPQKVEFLQKAMEEILSVATKMQIDLPADVVETSMKIFSGMPDDGKSSMQRDFETEGKETELEFLAKEIVKLGQSYGIATPIHQKIYDALK